MGLQCIVKVYAIIYFILFYFKQNFVSFFFSFLQKQYNYICYVEEILHSDLSLMARELLYDLEKEQIRYNYLCAKS